jgi:hypothetical protein
MLQTTLRPTIPARVLTERPPTGTKIPPIERLRKSIQRSAKRNQNQDPGSGTEGQEPEGRGDLAQAEICNRF